MAGISDFLTNELLDHTLGINSYTSPSDVYVALFTADPSSGPAGEVSGNNYSREKAAFDVASSGSSSNSDQLTFSASGGNWGTITHFAIYDNLTGGNLLYFGALDSSLTVNDGQSLVFNAGDLTVSLD